MDVKDFLFTEITAASEMIIETKACLFLRKLYDDFYQQTSKKG
jgi:hypothetical protein